MKKPTIRMSKILISFFIVFSLLFNSLASVIGDSDLDQFDEEGECKVIVVMNNATAGDYNLHMKVRDPSRTGGQVLFMLEPGYNYTYHHPLTGEVMNFTVKHKIIGTATAGDIPPNLLKPGMVLTSAGISFGDADNPTLEHINKNETAWDDFDWMRFAFQNADSEYEAVQLLTQVAVDELHATSIGETLFVLGPDKGYAIEADADHYYIHEIEDYYVKSNYAEFLWEQCSYFTDKYAPKLETKFNGWVIENQTVKLGVDCSHGVRILKINEDKIIARRYPDDGKNVTIDIGETENVYNFRVKVFDINSTENTVQITLCYKYLEWRDKVSDLVASKAGDITIQDMFAWSRLHTKDLDGLRGFCEGSETRHEVVNIFKHPDEKPELMSSLWFAGIPCCSVYIPIHICVEEIYQPYLSGQGWNRSLRLLENYTHGALVPILERIEGVFLIETEKMENICFNLNNTMYQSINKLMTISDFMLQYHGYNYEQMLLELARLKTQVSNDQTDDFDIINNSINNMWQLDYNQSLNNMLESLDIIVNILNNINLSSNTTNHELSKLLIMKNLRDSILDTIETTAIYKLEEVKTLVNTSYPLLVRSENLYQQGLENISISNYSAAGHNFIRVLNFVDELLQMWPELPKIPENPDNPDETDDENPEDNLDDKELEPDTDGGYDPEDIDNDTTPTGGNESTDQSQTWTSFDYMLISGIIILVVILAGINVMKRKKNKKQ
jgi:hypothetical protein